MPQSQITPVDAHGQPCLALSLPAGDRALVALYGAHLLSWTTAEGTERLYLSPRAVFDGKTAIRGGVPVCFPQFAGRGPLPKHGFARNTAWRRGAVTTGDGEAGVQLHLQDDDATRALWPHAFGLTLDLRLRSGELEMTLTIVNPGAEAFGFTAALHSYLQVDAIADVRLHGLDGSGYVDSVDGSSRTQAQAPLAIEGEVDRIYPRPDSALRLVQASSAVHIRQSPSFGDTVVWNPGAELGAKMGDMAADGYRHMLCVEAGCITAPAEVKPGAQWQGWQRLTIESTS